MAEVSLSQTPAHIRHGSNIGQPLTRRDGVLKVTGAADYAADHHPPGMLYAVLRCRPSRAVVSLFSMSQRQRLIRAWLK